MAVPTTGSQSNRAGQFTAKSAFAITASDVTEFPATVGIYVGAVGNLAVTMEDGTSVTFVDLTAGVIHPISATQVLSTGTTATGIIGVY